MKKIGLFDRAASLRAVSQVVYHITLSAPIGRVPAPISVGRTPPLDPPERCASQREGGRRTERMINAKAIFMVISNPVEFFWFRKILRLLAGFTDSITAFYHRRVL